jgi:hypothetical protein
MAQLDEVGFINSGSAASETDCPAKLKNNSEL